MPTESGTAEPKLWRERERERVERRRKKATAAADQAARKEPVSQPARQPAAVASPPPTEKALWCTVAIK